MESAPGGLLVNNGVEQSPTHFDSSIRYKTIVDATRSFGLSTNDKAQRWSEFGLHAILD